MEETYRGLNLGGTQSSYQQGDKDMAAMLIARFAGDVDRLKVAYDRALS